MKNWKIVWLILVMVTATMAWAEDRGRPRSLDECGSSADYPLSPTMDYVSYSYELDEDDGDCGRRPGNDVTYRLEVRGNGLYTIDIEEDDGDVWSYLTTGCCDGDQLFPRGLIESRNSMRCIWLETGIYYLTLEGENANGEVNIYPCNNPCSSVPQEDGFNYEGSQVVYVETVNAQSDEPNYSGPWMMQGPRCQQESANEDGEWVGFGYYNWYNQDFSWDHFFNSNLLDCEDYTIDSACVIICAYENDYCLEGPSTEASYCQWDVVEFEEGFEAGILNPNVDPSNNLSVSETRIAVPLEMISDGRLGVHLDIDANSNQCAWATEVWSSKLVVYITCGQIPPGPEGYDLGDLPNLDENEDPCYPTNTPESGGPANAVFAAEEQVAWLGECVTHEQFPNTVDDDGCDDGIYFVPSDHSNGSWMPGEEACIEVMISTGPAYQQGTPLYLWGWKDGNLDCDFDDVMSGPGRDIPAPVTECIIPGIAFYPPGPNSTITDVVCFIDPGVLNFGRYDGHLRFRLLSCGPNNQGPDRDVCDCSTAQTYVDDALGETEDYIVADLQLAVELVSFTATSMNGHMVLSWATASENQNDAFEIQKWSGQAWARAGDLVAGAGTSGIEHRYVFTDADVVEGQDYRYRLVTIDVHGNRMPVREVMGHVDPVNTVVQSFALHQNFPNPFNPTTEIIYDLAEATDVSLMVFDLLGREVASLVSAPQSAGRHTISFDATGLPSGMYFYRLQTAQFTDMKKMMLMK